MKRGQLLWGTLLTLAGVLFLLQEFDVIPSAMGVLWAVLFAAGGGVFLYAFTTDRSQWWPLIPGVSLVGLGVLIFLEEFVPNLGNWGGAVFLGSIGLAFLLVYLVNREAWWAIIPGGVLLTLAAVAGVEDVFDFGENFGGGIFFLGLGLTFLLVGIIPTPQGRMKWAFIPAAVLLIIGLFLTTPLLPLLNYLWPIALIALGGYFILRK